MGLLLSDAPIESFDAWVAVGGGEGLGRARRIGADQTIQELRLARLRGRGGAGFPTAAKWESVRAGGPPTYLAVNAAEGEPGTFKDRTLLRTNPYQLVEGAAIAALAVGAREVFFAIKRTFARERAALERAIGEAEDAGWFEVPVKVRLGPDEYLFGEEKAMLEVIEGNAPLPRLLPPYQHGLFATGVQLGWEAHSAEPGTVPSRRSNPTAVNNVETLSNVPHILARGAEWFRTFGTAESPGTIVCTVVGDLAIARLVEVEMGTPLRAVLGAPVGDHPIKAVLSGASNPVITDLDVRLTYEDMAAAGGGLGSAGFIAYDETACMVEVARLFSQFLFVESCGQCPACKLGTEAITERLTNVELGRGADLDLDTIGARLRSVTDGNRCALPIEEQAVVASIMRAFPEEFVAHLEARACPRPRPLVMPKLVDIVDGKAIYDEHYRFKQPDWTYADGTPPDV